jgi:hypothetical protein
VVETIFIPLEKNAFFVVYVGRKIPDQRKQLEGFENAVILRV